MINLIAADISDSAGAQLVLGGVRQRWPWLKHLFADGAHDRTRPLDRAAYLDFVIEIVRRNQERAGFHVIRRRWVVERTFGWMTRWRRLVRAYEARLDISRATIHRLVVHPNVTQRARAPFCPDDAPCRRRLGVDADRPAVPPLRIVLLRDPLRRSSIDLRPTET